MRVLQVTSSSQRRGAEVFADQLERALSARGHDVRTVALQAPDSPRDLPFAELPPGRFAPRVLAALTRESRAAHVVVAHGGSTLQVVAPAATAARRPFVYRNIGDPAHWGAARMTSWRVGLPLRRAAHVAALYDSAGRYLIEQYRVRPDRVTVVGNAVPAERFPTATSSTRAAAREQLGLPADRPVVGYLGAMSPEKQPGRLLDVAASLPGVAVRLAGDGPLRAALEADVDRLPAGADVELLAASDASTFLSALDVLVVPSRTEGVPGVVIEAALTGTPVVATAVGGVADTVAELGCGTTVAVDDTDALVAAVRTALDDPDPWRADRATVVARHDLPAVVEQWEALLRGVARTA